MIRFQFLIIALALGIILEPLTALAEPIPPYRLLRKISRTLRGIDPSPKELLDLREAFKNGQGQQHIEVKTKAYFQSSEFSDRFLYWVAGLYKVPAQVVPKEIKGLPKKDESNLVFNALVRSIGENNLSWDQLITSRNYPGYPTHPTDMFYDPTDKDLAGILTTRTIFSRFAASEINENRRIAQMIFDVLLCNKMRLQVETGQAEDHEYTGTLQAIELGIDASTALKESVSTAELHGKQAGCMTCHIPLDPMGAGFPDRMEFVSKYRPSTNESAIKIGKAGIDIRRTGIGLLMDEMVQLDQYKSCQVQNIWSFIDARPLPKEHITTLVSAYDHFQGRTQDFLAYLISSPSFIHSGPAELPSATPKPETKVTFGDIVGTLQKCDECHMSMDGPITLDRLAGNKRSHIIDQMLETLRLPPEHDLAMPQSREDYTEVEIDNLITWLEQEQQERN